MHMDMKDWFIAIMVVLLLIAVTIQQSRVNKLIAHLYQIQMQINELQEKVR